MPTASLSCHNHRTRTGLILLADVMMTKRFDSSWYGSSAGVLRQDRVAACGSYAAAVTEVKRAVITAWFRRDVRDDEWRAAMTEPDAWARRRSVRRSECCSLQTMSICVGWQMPYSPRSPCFVVQPTKPSLNVMRQGLRRRRKPLSALPGEPSP